ncbi:putative alpha amylase catalytic domain protein [Roseburia sp. CAG:309]|nr:putative alpha amylase catalytic domain protein [Roseburia sp. CAG:309]
MVTPNNTDDKIEWTSSNDNVVSVKMSGNRADLKAVSAGTATLTATATSGVSASITLKTNTNRSANCSVTVKQPAKSIKIYLNKPNVKKVYMAKGQTLSIKAEKNPLTSTDTLSYKTNKKKVAIVSASGVITAKKKGTAKITVQASSGKKAVKKIKIK